MASVRTIVESLLEKPYRVIDILPEQVSANAPGRYFAVERYYLEPSRYGDIRKCFAEIVLKLYCYDDLSVLLGDGDEPCVNPEPELLADRIVSAKQHICLLIGKGTLLTIGTDDLYMTVYNADGPLEKRLELLAKANGLFLR